MARKKKGEDKLIMPKHLAEEAYFLLPLQIYHDHPNGIAFSDKGTVPGFKSLLAKALHNIGKENKRRSDDTHYTKCAQLPRYFGFVRYTGPDENKGEGAITDIGERMLSALKSTPRDNDTIYELLFRSLTSLSFGSRTEGVGSDSCYEPFPVFFKASKLLDGIMPSEFGYLIQKLDAELVPFLDVIEDIRQKRASGKTISNPEGTQAHNIQDWTAILLLKYLGFLQGKPASNRKQRFSLADSLKAKYENRLTSMSIFSRGFKRQLFSTWLVLVEHKDEETSKAYCESLSAMSKDVGTKNSAIFEGFFRILTGHMPDIPVFEVADLEEFKRVFQKLNQFLTMPKGKQSGVFEWARYDECYYYTKAPQCIDNGRLFNACKAYIRFLEWWESRKSQFLAQEAGSPTRDFGEGYESLQLIKYGAPGTGKSKKTDDTVKDDPTAIRVTFHPDSDYSSFVGCYKPMMKPIRRVNCIDDKAKEVVDATGKPSIKDAIVYQFVPQAFAKAYVRAWEKMTEWKTNGGNWKRQYLVIEEINRGNCAQIFGDLFQLLDRDNAGYSKYPVDPDMDLAKHLFEWFHGKGTDSQGMPSDDSAAKVNGTIRLPFEDADVKTSWDDVLSGRKLVLPPNLYIWATMNTSDQSLFPIDSAFKRRWEWEYVPITKHAEENYEIKIDSDIYDWWTFVEAINERILQATESEDKKLGYFFVKAEKKDGRNVIDADRFLNKVVFYLWNDVFKNSEPERAFRFKKPGEDKESDNTFQDFFNKETGERDNAMLKEFLKNLGVTGTKIEKGGSKAGASGGQDGAVDSAEEANGGEASEPGGEEADAPDVAVADGGSPDTPESEAGNGSAEEG